MGVLNEPGFWGTVIAIVASLSFTYVATKAIRKSQEEQAKRESEFPQA